MDVRSIADGVRPGPDGIWYSEERADVSYPSAGNVSCYSVEERSFWFQHRNRCILSLIQAFPPPGRGPILDVGAGNGFVSLELTRAGFDVIPVEPFQAGALNAKARGLAPVICSTFDDAQFKAGSLPAVGLFDVIEHVEDDLGFLKSIRRALKDGGRIYVTVPAHKALWSDADIRAGHHRRYALEGLKSLFRSAGCTVEYASYFFRFLPVGIFLARALPHRLGLTRSTRTRKQMFRDHGVDGGLVPSALSFLHRAEARALTEEKRIRFGGSCILVAAKSSTAADGSDSRPPLG